MLEVKKVEAFYNFLGFRITFGEITFKSRNKRWASQLKSWDVWDFFDLSDPPFSCLLWAAEGWSTWTTLMGSLILWLLVWFGHWEIGYYRMEKMSLGIYFLSFLFVVLQWVTVSSKIYSSCQLLSFSPYFSFFSPFLASLLSSSTSLSLYTQILSHPIL